VPALALLLDDPARDIAPKIRANARQHGLTAVETELACRLADGRTVDEAASDQLISVHTARKYLQQIFAKTSTSRQAELVRVPISGTVPRAAVKAVLPRATVWPVLGHAAYLERLNACDMTLSTFPFGGLHSTIDSLSQGLPVVAMAGEQPHSRTDATMLRIAGMPGWLCAADPASYVAAALRIAGDDGLRVALSRQALACDVPGRLFGDASTPLGSDVSGMFTWIHANHEAIQASGLRVVRPPAAARAAPPVSSPSIPASCPA